MQSVVWLCVCWYTRLGMIHELPLVRDFLGVALGGSVCPERQGAAGRGLVRWRREACITHNLGMLLEVAESGCEQISYYKIIQALPSMGAPTTPTCICEF